MTVFHDRHAIGLRDPNPAHLSTRTQAMVDGQYGFTIHWTASGLALFREDAAERLRGIQAFHMDTLGYGDIAYEGAFDADGNSYGLRDSKWVGAHALGTKRGGPIPNQWTNGLVFLEDQRGWTQAAGVALAWWADLFRFTHGRSPRLWAHEYWSFTECPGPYLDNVVRFLGGAT